MVRINKIGSKNFFRLILPSEPTIKKQVLLNRLRVINNLAGSQLFEFPEEWFPVDVLFEDFRSFEGLKKKLQKVGFGYEFPERDMIWLDRVPRLMEKIKAEGKNRIALARVKELNEEVNRR